MISVSSVANRNPAEACASAGFFNSWPKGFGMTVATKDLVPTTGRAHRQTMVRKAGVPSAGLMSQSVK